MEQVRTACSNDSIPYLLAVNKLYSLFISLKVIRQHFLDQWHGEKTEANEDTNSSSHKKYSKQVVGKTIQEGHNGRIDSVTVSK